MRNRIATIGAVVAILIVGVRVDAHRLDEYLQATRVSIELDRVTLEIDLTPGASLASKVIQWIDADGNGQLSGTERSAYAQQVIDSVTVSLDGMPKALALTDSAFPDFETMPLGTGTIRLRAAAGLPAAASGRHVLTILNSHRPETSVYLANAMVPADQRIAIASQRRDPSQSRLTLEYDVASGRWPWVVLLALLLVILGIRSGFLYRLLPGRARRRGAVRATAPSSRV
jgi:hypothetical protein